MKRLALHFAHTPIRAPSAVAVAIFFIVAPGIPLQILGVPVDGYTRWLFAIFGAAFILKGLVHHAYLRLPIEQRGPFLVANAVFEATLSLVLGVVLVAGPPVGLLVYVLTALFGIEAMLDAWASRLSKS